METMLEGSSLLDYILLQVLLGHDGKTVVWGELGLGQYLLHSLPLAPMLPPAALCYLSTLSTLRNRRCPYHAWGLKASRVPRHAIIIHQI